MKKILFLLLLLIPLNVKANEFSIAIQNDESIIYYPYETKRINYLFYFELSPFINYKITDENYINNLSYLSVFDTSDLYITTIQTLIWQHTLPDYTFYIVDENHEKVDNTKELESIKQKFNNLTEQFEFTNVTYELNPNEEITIKSQVALNSYNISNDDILKDNYTINLKYQNKGTYVIDFTNKSLEIDNGLITGYEFFYNPFQITVIIDDFQDITVSTIKDDQIIENNISIYDSNDNLVKSLTSKEDNIRLKNGQYKFIDETTKEEVIIDIDENTSNITFNHYSINGIKTDMDITKVCQEDICFPFKVQNNIYIFASPLTNGYYEIYTSNEKVIYNFNNKENYINDDALGLLYFIDYEKPNNPIKEEISNNDNITIDIPNTENSLPNPNKYIVIIKKKEFEI